MQRLLTNEAYLVLHKIAAQLNHDSSTHTARGSFIYLYTIPSATQKPQKAQNHQFRKGHGSPQEQYVIKPIATTSRTDTQLTKSFFPHQNGIVRQREHMNGNYRPRRELVVRMGQHHKKAATGAISLESMECLSGLNQQM